MDCRTAESMIQRYIDHDLSIRELEEFTEHVKKCPSCYDELETYFTVSTAIQHLNGDIDDELEGTMDMNRLLQADIKHRTAVVRHWKIQKGLGIFFCCLVICVLVALMIWFFLL